MTDFTPQGDIDLKGVYDIKNPATPTDVSISGTPVDNDFAKFTDSSTIEGRSYSEVRTDLNVADGSTANSSDATLLARANHTGTQAASTISDFDTEVGNNSAVSANTSKNTNVPTALSTGTVDGTSYGITSDSGANDVILAQADTNKLYSESSSSTSPIGM